MEPEKRLLTWRVKILKLGHTSYVHIPALMLDHVKAQPGDWTTIIELPDGSFKIEIERPEDFHDRKIQ